MADMLSQDEINALLAQAGGSDDGGDLGGGLDNINIEPTITAQPAATTAVQSPVQQAASVQSTMSFTQIQPQIQMPAKGDMGLFGDISMKISVFLGKTKMPLKEALKLGKDSIVELDKLKGEPADVFLNNKLFARGEIVVVDEHFGIRINKIIEPAEREELLKRS